MKRSLLALAVVAATPAAALASGSADPVIAASHGYARMVARVYPSAFVPSRSPAPPTSRPTVPFAAEICAAARRHGIRPAFLFAIVEVESAFDPNALSSKGARGLAQVMPATAREVGVSPGALWHPATNAEAAARYLRFLGARYGNDLAKVLAGYNAGPAVADGRKPMPAETRAYVPRATAAYRRYLAIERRGGRLCGRL